MMAFEHERQCGGKTAEIVQAIIAELHRAEALHPVWPGDIVHQAAIMVEEAGETLQAANNYRFHGGELELARVEAIQAGAMAIRFLKNLPGGRP